MTQLFLYQIRLLFQFQINQTPSYFFFIFVTYSVDDHIKFKILSLFCDACVMYLFFFVYFLLLHRLSSFRSNALQFRLLFSIIAFFLLLFFFWIFFSQCAGFHAISSVSGLSSLDLIIHNSYIRLAEVISPFSSSLFACDVCLFFAILVMSVTSE